MLRVKNPHLGQLIISIHTRMKKRIFVGPQNVNKNQNNDK